MRVSYQHFHYRAVWISAISVCFSLLYMRSVSSFLKSKDCTIQFCFDIAFHLEFLPCSCVKFLCWSTCALLTNVSSIGNQSANIKCHTRLVWDGKSLFTTSFVHYYMNEDLMTEFQDRFLNWNCNKPYISRKINFCAMFWRIFVSIYCLKLQPSWNAARCLSIVIYSDGI